MKTRFTDGARIVVPLSVFAALLTFANTLPNTFAYDDIPTLRALARLVDDGRWFASLYRSLTHATFLADWAVWRLHPLGYHITNVLLHAVATGLATHVILRLTGQWSVALASGLLFAVHPVHVEAVASFYNRKEILAVIFALLSLNCWIASHNRRWTYGGAFLFFCLGMLSKEVAVVGVVPMLLLADILLTPRRSWGARRVGRSLLRLAPLLLAALGAAAWALHGQKGFFSSERIRSLSEWPIASYATVLANCFSSFPDIFRLLFFPLRLSPDYPIRPDATLSDPQALLGVLLVVAWIGAALYTARRSPLISFAMAWTIIMYLPVSNIFPLTHYFVAERYLYVPSLGICILLGTVVARAAKVSAGVRALPPSYLYLLLLLVIAGGARSAARNRDWHDEKSLWSAAVRDGYRTFRIHYHLGRALSSEGRHDEAIAEFRHAFYLVPEPLRTRMCSNILRVYPDDVYCNCFMAENARRAGQSAVAAFHDERALSANPNDVTTLVRLAWLLAVTADGKLRDPVRAMDLASRAVKLEKRPTARSLYTLAAAHAEVGQFGEALSLSREALRLALEQGDQELASRLRRGIGFFDGGTPLSRTQHEQADRGDE